MPGQVFASTEDHATFAITTTLKGFCRGGSIAFCDACRIGWCGEEWGVVGGDEGHVVVVVVVLEGGVEMRGRIDVVCVEGRRF